jgi:hypothetical protein
MATIQLVHFLTESADELLGKAENATPITAELLLDEAEELLELGASIMSRYTDAMIETREAA